MQAPAPTTVHTRINARASVSETQSYFKQLMPLGVFTEPLAAVSIIIEAEALYKWAAARPYTDYCEQRRRSYTAYPTAPRSCFLGRFSHATRAAAQQLADTYTIYL